jgi:hypothetical protein
LDNTGKNIIMKPEELTIFKGLVENNLMYSFENATNYQNTASNALNGLHDDGEIGGTGDSKYFDFVNAFNNLSNNLRSLSANP